MYGMIRPGQVSYRPMERQMLNRGPTSDTTGNMAMASAIARTSFLPRNLRRAMAYAANVASAIESTVAMREMPMEFRSALVKSGVLNTVR